MPQHIVGVFLVLVCLSGCLAGCQRLSHIVHGKPKIATKTAEAPPSELMRRAQLWGEVYRVVWMKNPTPKVFGFYFDALSEGATLEGFHNGFTHSSLYRDIEKEAPPCGACLKPFAKIVAQFQNEFESEVTLDETWARPMTRPVDVQYREAKVEKEIKAPPNRRIPLQKREADLERVFSKASVYNLKRVAAELAQQIVDEKTASGNESAVKWYTEFVVRMTSYGVDFGLKERNNANMKFHSSWAAWALKNDPDLFRWEVLNRVHRVIAHAMSSALPSASR